jgi:hypothetical protein
MSISKKLNNPKHAYSPYLYLLIFTVLFAAPFLVFGVLKGQVLLLGQDIFFHLDRYISGLKAFDDGQIIPRFGVNDYFGNPSVQSYSALSTFFANLLFLIFYFTYMFVWRT